MTKPKLPDIMKSYNEMHKTMTKFKERCVPNETEMDKLFKMTPPQSTIKHNYMHGGEQIRYQFENGYGASVVCHSFSYGGEQGLLELAVLDKEGKLCYSTPVTDDVEGWLTAEKAMELLKQIAELRR